MALEFTPRGCSWTSSEVPTPPGMPTWRAAAASSTAFGMFAEGLKAFVGKRKPVFRGPR